MRSLWPLLRTWVLDDHPFALATVVAVRGSAPREVGSVLAVDASGIFHGGVSSGCLEGEVVVAALESLRTGAVRGLCFGPEGDPVWSGGLTCGGEIMVRVEPYFAWSPDPVVREIAAVWHAMMDDGEPACLLSRGAEHLLMMADGSCLGDRNNWDEDLFAAAQAHVREGRPSVEVSSGRGAVFFRALNRRSKVVCIGASDLGLALARAAGPLDLEVHLVDPRTAYLAPERLAGVRATVHAQWPQRILGALNLGPDDALVVLSHDAKIDAEALTAARVSQAGWIGLLGSRALQERRRAELRSSGWSAAELERIEGPAGLPIGSRTPEEIATSILASIIRHRRLGGVGGKPGRR